ncbi:MAG: hypothetical protein ACPHJD_07765, partial [Poseidonia sp.]
MALPFRRKGSEGDDDPHVDLDIEDILDEAEGEPAPVIAEPRSEEPPSDEEELDEHQKMLNSALTVIDTCMDLRRGENILIVCDPTTTDIGQALHDAASMRSD